MGISMKQWHMHLLFIYSKVLATFVTHLDVDFVKVSSYDFYFGFLGFWMVET
jgi:hypothetical protein